MLLRHSVCLYRAVVTCRELLHSSQLDVSYFAGGIISHLLADESTRDLLSVDTTQQLNHELVPAISPLFDALQTVMNWYQPSVHCLMHYKQQAYSVYHNSHNASVIRCLPAPVSAKCTMDLA